MKRAGVLTVLLAISLFTNLLLWRDNYSMSPYPNYANHVYERFLEDLRENILLLEAFIEATDRKEKLAYLHDAVGISSKMNEDAIRLEASAFLEYKQSFRISELGKFRELHGWSKKYAEGEDIDEQVVIIKDRLKELWEKIEGTNLKTQESLIKVRSIMYNHYNFNTGMPNHTPGISRFSI